MTLDLKDDTVDVKKSTPVSQFKNELQSDGVRVKTFRCTVLTLPRGTLHRAMARVERPGTDNPNAASKSEQSIFP